MVITPEFLQAEIADLKQEAEKANTFLIQARAAIDAYTMLLNRLYAPEPETPDGAEPTA